ncbi:60S ribosomal protein-like protein L34 [Amylocarpus encephaloides]|uniref:60S ribosomal protein-like protein L34 n=1 Tax=Amylocarpus encephaloides TaxID=45428 RepID=A0A9P8CAM6_9HELO|nr:60S ribosomal protein-like protein L34 [Amylocarpus encephaloides]
MLCLRCSLGLGAVTKQSNGVKTARNVVAQMTFASFTPLRPTIFPSAFTSSLRSPLAPPPSSTSAAATEAQLDLNILPFKPTTHPAMEAMQIRCAPRNTFNPSHFVRKRRHGFLARLRSRTGRMIIKRRRAKRRSTLSH